MPDEQVAFKALKKRLSNAYQTLQSGEVESLKDVADKILISFDGDDLLDLMPHEVFMTPEADKDLGKHIRYLRQRHGVAGKKAFHNSVLISLFILAKDPNAHPLLEKFSNGHTPSRAPVRVMKTLVPEDAEFPLSTPLVDDLHRTAIAYAVFAEGIGVLAILGPGMEPDDEEEVFLGQTEQYSAVMFKRFQSAYHSLQGGSAFTLSKNNSNFMLPWGLDRLPYAVLEALQCDIHFSQQAYNDLVANWKWWLQEYPDDNRDDWADAIWAILGHASERPADSLCLKEYAKGFNRLPFDARGISPPAITEMRGSRTMVVYVWHAGGLGILAVLGPARPYTWYLSQDPEQV